MNDPTLWKIDLEKEAKHNYEMSNILKAWGYNDIESKSFNNTQNLPPGFTVGLYIFNKPSGTIYFSDNLLSMLDMKELEFCILHEVAHIINNDLLGNYLVDLMSIGGMYFFSEVFEVNPKIPEIIIKFFRTISEKTPNGIIRQAELRCDNWAARCQNNNIYGISSLMKLSNGCMEQISHTSRGFTFEVPVLTIKERIDALSSITF